MKKEIKINNGILYYDNTNLLELANKYSTPLKVTFLDVIKERVTSLKNTFDEKIKETGYAGNFIYVNANKANYETLEIKEAVYNADGIETSSYTDLLLSKDIIKSLKQKNKLIVSNGYKTIEYRSEIVKINNQGYNILAIIDSLDEYEFYKNQKLNKPLQVGLRIHLKSLYHEEGDIVLNDRFGLLDEEVQYILNDIENTNLLLTTIHFHQRGFSFEEEKFIENINIVFEKYFVTSRRKYSSVVNFDIGGGTPLPTNEDFDYESFALMILGHLKALSNKYKIKEPNIISENGKYSQKDACINIYKTVGYKKTDIYPWHLIDGSLLIAMPEHYALGEEILVMPINNLNSKMEKARLSSITCDCDDIFFNKETGYIELPEEIKDKPTYIGIFGTGSYQNSMAGKGGIHHCLLPEEKDVIIYTKNGKKVIKVRKEKQSYSQIKKLAHFKDKK